MPNNKIHIQLALVFVFACSILNAQNEGYEVTYHTISSYDFTKLENDPSISPERLQQAKKVKKHTEDISYILKFNRDSAIFQTEMSMSLDQFNNPMRKVQEKQIFYIDKDVLIHKREMFGEKLLITEKSFNQEWEIKSDQKKILNYTCRKAILNYSDAGNPVTIVAWFAPDLNFSFGPKGYHGLPGLILSAERNNVLKYEAVSIEASSDLYISKPADGKIITRESVDERTKVIVKKMTIN